MVGLHRLPVLALLLCEYLSFTLAGYPPAALPRELLTNPPPVDASALPRLAGRIIDRDVLMRRPRAVVGYVSDGAWAFQEFVTMTHASWRMMPALHGSGQQHNHNQQQQQQSGLKMDLIVFAHPKWSDSCQQLCLPVDLDVGLEGIFNSTQSQCFAVSYVPPPTAIWHGYPFINNVHFFADPRVQRMLIKHYGYAMKTDFDTFLSPAIGG